MLMLAHTILTFYYIALELIFYLSLARTLHLDFAQALSTFLIVHCLLTIFVIETINFLKCNRVYGSALRFIPFLIVPKLKMHFIAFSLATLLHIGRWIFGTNCVLNCGTQRTFARNLFLFSSSLFKVKIEFKRFILAHLRSQLVVLIASMVS